MITERKTKEAIEVENQNSEQSEIWSINSILFNIFTYSNRNDMLEFRTVSKKWNSVINPFIYNTIKLRCKPNALSMSVCISDNTDKCDTEVMECISNNSKHAELVKEFSFCYDIGPLRAMEFFQTFRFICNLTIRSCNMSQDQFLDMISPLSQLQELTLSNLRIINIFSNRSYKEADQLPSSLRKLSLGVNLIDNPELFVQAINSHNSLTEFSYSSSTNEFLDPLYKPYPSLAKFEYNNQKLQSPQVLTKIFEHNPQITTFKLSLRYWDSEYINCISSCFINLEELILAQYLFCISDNLDINLKLSQPTKIKKLEIQSIKLSNSSLNSILINCPHLEDLVLTPYIGYDENKSISFIDHYISTKIKTLSIDCNYLSEGDFRTLLLNSPQINVLNVTLPCGWKETIKSISENCGNLARLGIFHSFQMREQESRIFHQEFYKTEFFTSKTKCKSTLTHLTLNNFNAFNSKSEHFKNFESLKSIIYPPQGFFDVTGDYQGTKIDMSLWPGYIFVNIGYSDGYGAEFKRL
jgi:hypothetical protein